MKYTAKTLVATGLALSIVLAMALTGCGVSPREYVGSAAAPAESYMMDNAMGMVAPKSAPQIANGEAGETTSLDGNDMAPPSPTPIATAAPADQPRKLVKNSQLALETKEFESALDALVKMVETTGGYVDNQSVNGVSLRDSRDYYERSASITARIPADKLGSFTTQAGELCNIVSHSEGVSDITDGYYDAQSRLEVLRVKEARLTELLAQAEKLEDIIQLEDALSNCQYEMDSLTGQLRRMDSLVSYSTCNITLDEVVEYSDVAPVPKTFGERLGDSARYSWRNLSTSVQDTIIRLIESGPVAVFYLLVWFGLIYLVYRLVMLWRKRGHRAAKPVITTTAVVEDTTPPTDE